MQLKPLAGAASTLALVIALSSPVLAQTMERNSADQQGATATNPAGSDMILPDQMRASKIIGANVYDRNNVKLGDVQDIVLDKSGRVAAVVLSVGGFLGVGTKDVAVRMSDITTDNNRLTLDRTKAQLQQAANYQLRDKYSGAGEGASPATGGQAGSGTSVPPASHQ
jgi:sporulation protein YlmC with PRC-barrel domain